MQNKYQNYYLEIDLHLKMHYNNGAYDEMMPKCIEKRHIISRH